MDSSPSKLFRKFCKETTLHGLQYIIQSDKHIYERIFWTIAFCLGVLTSTGLIKEIYTQFNSNPMVVTFKPTQASIDQVPFPAITICNVNHAQKSSFEVVMNFAKDPEKKDTHKYMYYLDHYCSAAPPSFSNRLNFSSENSTIPTDWKELIEQTSSKESNYSTNLNNFLEFGPQSCFQMLIQCRWEDEIKDCWELFKATTTDFGMCCTFNMAPLSLLHRNKDVNFPEDELLKIEWNKSDLSIDAIVLDNDQEYEPPVYPKRLKRSGLSYGLSILVHPGIDEYFCTSSDSSGFQLVAHLPIESPEVSEYGLAIAPNSEVFLKITSDITMADRSIEFMKPEKRKCYLMGEYSLKYYVNYTSTNCFQECLGNMTYNNCGCVKYYMNRDAAWGLCGPNKYACAEKIKKEFVKFGKKGHCKKCLPTCTDISYLTEMTVRPMRTDKNIWIHRYYNYSAYWSGENASLVHIYFGEDTVYPKIRKRLYSMTDLIANAGGLLGLCLGFSALSGIELIYFLVITFLAKNIITKWKTRNAFRTFKPQTTLIL